MSIVGFGDFLMHFSPHDNDRFLQASSMDITFTGAEANVCAALGFWKEKVRFVTKLPPHDLSLKGKMFLKGFDIDTDFIQYDNGRMGVYFLEKGHSVRPSSVIYDRLGTVFTNSKYEDYNWDEILKDASAFYISGITPSLSDSLFDCCEKALKKSHKMGIPVFYDVNLRPSICDIEKSRIIFERLSPYITYLISNEEHLKQILDYSQAETEDKKRLLDLSQTISAKTDIKNIVITVRRTISAHQSTIFASYFNGENIAISPKYELDIVDRVGSGDAFSAGIVYSHINGFDIYDAIKFSAASCALKHTINSDINFSNVDEIKAATKILNYDVNR